VHTAVSRVLTGERQEGSRRLSRAAALVATRAIAGNGRAITCRRCEASPLEPLVPCATFSLPADV
jgi:hypothetical protein